MHTKTGWCCRCKKMREITHGAIKTYKGVNVRGVPYHKTALAGVCGRCGTRVNRFLSNAEIGGRRQSYRKLDREGESARSRIANKADPFKRIKNKRRPKKQDLDDYLSSPEF